jgi:hypothetical protein
MSSSSSTHRPFPHNYTTWTRGWAVDTVIVAVNSTFIPEPVPPTAVPAICLDGLWGHFEWMRHPQRYQEMAPYLAFIRLPIGRDEDDFLLCPFGKGDWQPITNKSGYFTLKEDLMCELTRRCHAVSEFSKSSFPFVSLVRKDTEIPSNALNNAWHCVSVLTKGVRSWHDFMEYVRNAQRALLEMEAFRDWWVDLLAVRQKGTAYIGCPRRSSRGAICSS